jgi:hypothetical protein
MWEGLWFFVYMSLTSSSLARLFNQKGFQSIQTTLKQQQHCTTVNLYLYNIFKNLVLEFVMKFKRIEGHYVPRLKVPVPHNFFFVCMCTNVSIQN